MYKSGIIRHARNLGGCVNSQAAWVEGIVFFFGGIGEECFQSWAGMGFIEEAFPGLVVLAGEEEAGEIDQFGLFVLRESLADFEDFFGKAHGDFIAENAGEFN
jgi:hypothetical protein